MIRALTDRGNRQPGRVDFSPVRNLLVATSEPEVVTLYDLDSGRETSFWRAPDKGSGKVRDLSFSMDGSKLVIYVAGSTVEFGDAVYVLNVVSAQVESRHATPFSHSGSFGAAQISPNNRLLYIGRSDFLNQRCSLQCLDLSTSQELWQTELLRDQGLTSLAISPDGRLLVSASGWEDSAIRVWDAATGRLLVRLDGHTAFVTKLAFSGDGRQLISGAGDQTIRFWDTGTWRETKTLRGHTEEINAIAISETAHLVASASKDGDVLLWRKDGESAVDGYRRLPEDLHVSQILPLDHSRVLLLPSGKPPDLIDLKRGALPVPQPQLGASSNVLGWFGTNILCLWNQTNQILVRKLEGDKFRQRGSVSVDSNTRPNGLAYNANRQLLAWDGGTSSPSVYAANLAAPGRRIELRSDVPGLLPFRFSEDGTHLAAWTTKRDSLHAWNVETGRKVVSIGGAVRDAIFAADGRVLVVALQLASDHEIAFYNLNQPERAPRRVSGRHSCLWLALSPDGEQVAAATEGGQVFLFDAGKGQLSGTFNGHLNAADSVAFSPDGRRLISTAVGQEAVKLWDVTTRQELLNFVGSGSGQAGVGQAGVGRWSPDGNFILLAGTPWQTWGAPTWEEIAVAEAKEKTETKQP
jgi:WD40 repeat protein